jgi:glycosyltransferase involved in cell wall biosynthesis
MDEFAAAAPEDVDFTDLKEAGTVVIGNCVTISPGIIPGLIDRRVIRYHHDLAQHEAPILRSWLDENAEHIFTSPLHRDRYGREGALVPPPVDLARFRPNRQTRRNTERSGACTVGSWQNPGKGAHLIAEWSVRNSEEVDCFGFGPYAPAGPGIRNHGAVTQGELPQILHGFERFVFLPTSVEPFGRCVVEAWAAGCEIVVNDLVGARYWLEKKPEALESATETFWRVVLTNG